MYIAFGSDILPSKVTGARDDPNAHRRVEMSFSTYLSHVFCYWDVFGSLRLSNDDITKSLTASGV